MRTVNILITVMLVLCTAACSKSGKNNPVPQSNLRC